MTNLQLSSGAIFDLPTPFDFVVILVMVCVAGGVISSVCKYIRDFAIHRQELAFKREMVERGLAIDEIADLANIKPTGLAGLYDDDNDEE